MRSIIRSITIAGLLASAAVSLEAQGPPVARRPLPGSPAARQLRRATIARVRMIERRAAMQGRTVDPRAVRDRVVAQRAVMLERIRNLTPEQKQLLRANRQAMRTERQAVGAQLRAGTITREQARLRMQTWRREHQLNLGLRGPRRGPGGEF